MLGYPDRKYTVVLMGSDRRTAAYIGTMDESMEAHPLRSEMHSGGTTVLDAPKLEALLSIALANRATSSSPFR